MPATPSRRLVLRSIASAGLLAALPASAAEAPSPWAGRVLPFLHTLRRDDGGYAHDDLAPRSHLTPTFAVVAAHHLLRQPLPEAAKLAAFLRLAHPGRLKKLEQEHREFDLHQIQALAMLGQDVGSFRDAVRPWVRPVPYLKQYEQQGHPVFRHQVAAMLCRPLVGLSLDDLDPEYGRYVDARRRPDGSFNNTPAADGGDGHVVNTLWGLLALQALGRLGERRDATVAFLRACQLPSGGFTHHPRPAMAGLDDVAYARAALRALRLLDAEPADRAGALAYLHSLANADGGFGDRPGWPSNATATFYALDALDALGALDEPPPRPAATRPSTRPVSPPLPSGLKVFSAQIEAHGRGSVADALHLARALRIHLWGAKNAVSGWVERAQALADRQRIPVTFFASNEEYGTWLRVPGLGTYSHISDVMGPAGANIGPALAGPTPLAWPDFRARRVEPLTRGRGRLVWQFGENEDLVRLLLDDSLPKEQGGQGSGYAAISTFHFGNPDFTSSEPFLLRYRGHIPFVALQDAHGNEPWWFADMTEGFRTLFLAEEPTYDAFRRALAAGRVAAVRRDVLSGGQTWIHAGDRAVLDFIREREADWRWWDNPAIARPLASLVLLRPDDRFEAGRPDRGLALRVRVAFRNTTQGLPREPLAQLVRLTVDDQEVRPALHAPRAARGQAFADHYHLHPLPDLPKGPHTATALVRDLASGRDVTYSLPFEV